MTPECQSQSVRLALERANVEFWPQAANLDLADTWLTKTSREVHFASESLRLYGRTIEVPRRVAWHGDPGTEYTYSRRNHRAEGWTPTLLAIRQWLVVRLGIRFNSVLCNLYRDGNDAMGWHADDESCLGPAPVIASLSLGATRRFGLRSRATPRVYHRMDLGHGSLLVMRGATQTHWQHCLYRTSVITPPRINLTFRQVLAPDVAPPRPRYTRGSLEGVP